MHLRHLTQLDVRPASFPANSCAETALAGVEALLVRFPERSLPALRVHVAWDLGEHVWERMMQAGRAPTRHPAAPSGQHQVCLEGSIDRPSHNPPRDCARELAHNNC